MKLSQVTLLGIDCLNLERLQAAIKVSQKDIEFGAVKILSSIPSDDPHVVNIPHIGSIEELSRFCIQDLNKYVETEYVLLVQYDGFVLNADNWDPAFLDYDYIGAPWDVGSWETDVFPEDMKGKLIVGNGGFCLRSKKFLEVSAKLANEGKITKFHPEDVAVCVWYRPDRTNRIHECLLPFLLFMNSIVSLPGTTGMPLFGNAISTLYPFASSS